MYNQVSKYFEENYDYSLFVGRNDWGMLINQAKIGSDILFIKQDDRLKAQINKELFNKISDQTAKNSGSTMLDRYFKYLPRKYHIASQQTSTGFILDVENFDKWLDDDTLMNKYQNSSSFRDKQQRDNQAQLTQTVDMLAKAMLEDHEQRRKEEAKKNHSWFGNLFHRN